MHVITQCGAYKRTRNARIGAQYQLNVGVVRTKTPHFCALNKVHLTTNKYAIYCPAQVKAQYTAYLAHVQYQNAIHAEYVNLLFSTSADVVPGLANADMLAHVISPSEVLTQALAPLSYKSALAHAMYSYIGALALLRAHVWRIRQRRANIVCAAKNASVWLAEQKRIMAEVQ
jgi:hypothetical protein